MAKKKKSESVITSGTLHAVRVKICENIYTYETNENKPEQEVKQNDTGSN